MAGTGDPAAGPDGQRMTNLGFPALETQRTLAFRRFWPQIRTGRLAVDEPLANRVRSGRKQP